MMNTEVSSLAPGVNPGHLQEDSSPFPSLTWDSSLLS